MGSVDGKRWNNHIHSRSVGQSRIHHGRRFVDVPANGRHNLVDDVHQVRIVLEYDVGLFQNAATLHIYFLRSIYQNVADGGVLHQWFQRAQAEDFIQDLERYLLPLPRTQRDREIQNEFLDDGEDLPSRSLVPHTREVGEVNFVQQVVVDFRFQLQVGATVQSSSLSGENVIVRVP